MPRHLPKPDPAILMGMGLFTGLSEAALAAVMDACHAGLAVKGTTIFKQGDTPRTCHALVDGRVKIQQSGPEGQQIVVQFVGPGEMFGTLAMFLRSGYPGDAVAVTDCVQIVWSADVMRNLMLAHPTIAMNTLGMLGARLEALQSRVRELSTERVERRVARALLRLADQAGRPVETGIEIGFPLSRQDVAEITGTTLHTVSRILSAWEGRGIVLGGRQHIVVARPDELCAIAQEPNAPPATAGTPSRPQGVSGSAV